MGDRGRLGTVIVLAAVVGAAAPSCAARDEAREACDEFYERLGACLVVDFTMPNCDEVKASEREHYDCLATLEDVCDVQSHAEC